MATIRPEYLGRWLPASIERSPPGMTYEDWQAWHPWLRGPGKQWELYTYDVTLHTEGLPAIAVDAKLMEMWARNTAKRIDAVGAGARGLDIFEARRLAGWSAIGQLLGYRDLWLINFPQLPLGDLWLISERIDDATRALAQRQGIRTWCCGEALEP
jgi:hypothetical protein